MAKLKYKDKDGFWQELPVGTNVVANPTLTGTESELTGLKVGGTYYKIPGNKEYVDNGFVKKTTGHNKVYATDSTGTDSELGYSQSPANSAITQYTSSGTVRTNMPINNLDCATKKYVDDNAVLRKLEDIIDTSANAFKTLKSGLYQINNRATSGFPNNLARGYYTVTVHHFGDEECTIFVQTVNKPDCYVAHIGHISGVNGFYNIATTDNIAALGKLYQHTYTFEAGTDNYVYCTTYKNSNTPMTEAEVINFFKSDPSVGKVVNVSVVDNGTTVGSGCFFDDGYGIDYIVIVLNSSASFIINADTKMTPNIIEI